MLDENEYEDQRNQRDGGGYQQRPAAPGVTSLPVLFRDRCARIRRHFFSASFGEAANGARCRVQME
jgi:hypothetical protein